MEIHFATTDEQLLKCRKAILELRPHVADDYMEKAQLLISEGAKFIYIDTGGADAPAVSVFRVNYYFFRGKNLYIDDLTTMASQRGKGYAGVLIDFMVDYAREQGCDNLHLDSGYGNNRFTAHRLYLNKGFYLASHHFTLDLK